MTRAHEMPRRGNRLLVVGLVGAAALTSAMAVAALATGAEPVAAGVVCPNPVDELPAIPAGARIQVERELSALDQQVAEANERLVSTAGQGGPNFAQNAILGPLRDKRAATLERIAIAIGREADRPEGLEQFATCALLGEGEQPAPTTTTTARETTSTTAAPEQEQDDVAARIACPDPTGALPAVPQAARAEVERELANLDRQVEEANERLVSTRGQGGPNFVDNAILGPLESKRAAALDRIEIAIGRVSDQRPGELESFAECSLG
ncbi:hypothetical protein JOF41_002339 [Saccharothrix coeruleofusca]|uniref:hypothetical protein n=1 Tax=Saccharothrix coeruleofusca TaxID=33919 RepID=UPI001AE9CF12|nr:hypothetical protein [Saccharothrix coeruleofusca]MBP2336161.1 hypothetical protein [Saccharothrix coeruleofusca]